LAAVALEDLTFQVLAVAVAAEAVAVVYPNIRE